MHALTSSWRTKTLASTRLKASELGTAVGVTRVTDITWLDRIGIPVYASIRPSAAVGSLCVCAGKGSVPEEARVGAIMEAVEFALAESSPARLRSFETSIASVGEQEALRAPFVGFCPIWQAPIDSKSTLEVVSATDFESGDEIAVPAELVLLPYGKRRLFGVTSNGLCSGNTLHEALLHGLCELVERDILAFNFFVDASAMVSDNDLPECVLRLERQIHDAGMVLHLRATRNSFGVPFFEAFIVADDGDPISIARGSGVHPSRDVAAVRAITEAAQSRLTYIHGARDDLTERAKYFLSREPDAERLETSRLLARISSRDHLINFVDVPSLPCDSIEGAIDVLRQRLATNGLAQVLYVDLLPGYDTLRVLRVIVPGLESFNSRLHRIGRRLANFISGA